MKKNFKYYAAIWAVLLVVFNLVVFLVRPVIPGFEVAHDGRFWIAWAFIIVAFIGNLVLAYIALKADNLQKVFYNLPLITISRAALIAMLVVGIVLMLIPNCPAWIAAVLCVLVLAFNAIAVIKAAWAAEAVKSVDEKIKTQTSFIKGLTADVEGLVSRAKNDEVRKACKKVFEAVLYSDPMSNDALSVIEAKITVKVDELADAVGEDDTEKVKEIAEEVLLLVGDRNRKCKAMK